MSLNDRNPGITNPTTSHTTTSSSTNLTPSGSNIVREFVLDSASDEFGASSGLSPKQAARQNYRQTAGVIEGRPGIIETSHIDPLNEKSLYEDEWKSEGSPIDAAGTGSAADILTSAAAVASGAARMAYGTLVGDEQVKLAGREAMFGKGA